MAYLKTDKFDHEKYLNHPRTKTLLLEFGYDWINNPKYKKAEEIIRDLFNSNNSYISNKVMRIIRDEERYSADNYGFGLTIGALLVAHKHFNEEIAKLKKAKMKKEEEIRDEVKKINDDYGCTIGFSFDIEVDY